MPNSTPLSKRKKAVQAYERGNRSIAEIAANHGISEATLTRLLRRQRSTGSLAPKKHVRYGRKPFLEPDDLQLIQRLTSEQPQLNF